MDILISTLVILFTTNLAMVSQKAYFHKISVNYVALFFWNDIRVGTFIK